MSLSWRWLCPNLVPEVRFSFGQHQEHGLWPLPRQEVHKSQTSGMSTHAQKIETTVIVNGYKNGPSLPLPINWKKPESVFLVLTKRKANSGGKIGCGQELVKLKEKKWDSDDFNTNFP